jgi:hypothetical protein
MRSKKQRADARGAQRRPLTQAPRALRQARADNQEDILPNVTSVNDPAHTERVLIDRFGHLHSRNVLEHWPDKVRAAMGLRFVDSAEVDLGAGDGRAR